MRRAGTGTSSGMSRKCRRSETNTTHGIAVYFRRPIFAPLLDRALRHLPPVVGHALPAWRGFPPGTYSVHGAPIMSPALPVKTHATMPAAERTHEGRVIRKRQRSALCIRRRLAAKRIRHVCLPGARPLVRSA